MLKINGLKLTVYYWFLSQLSISRWASTSIRNSYLQLLWVNLTFRNLSLHITNITEDELPWKESYLKRYSEKLLTVGTLKRKENWYKNWKRKIFKIYLYVERKKCITAVALYIAYYIKKINLEIDPPPVRCHQASHHCCQSNPPFDSSVPVSTSEQTTSLIVAKTVCLEGFWMIFCWGWQRKTCFMKEEKKDGKKK